MIIWINGAFGAGKKTLAEGLRRRFPEAVLFDPEYVGYILREWVPVPTGDFLHLDANALRQRIIDRILSPDNPEQDQRAREFCLRNLERGIAAATNQSEETLTLRSDKLNPAELADEILARLRN